MRRFSRATWDERVNAYLNGGSKLVQKQVAEIVDKVLAERRRRRRGRGRRGRGGRGKGGKTAKKSSAPKINPWTGKPADAVKTCRDAALLVQTGEALCKLCWKCCKKRRRTTKISREKTGGWFWHAARSKNCQWWAWKKIFFMKRML